MENRCTQGNNAGSGVGLEEWGQRKLECFLFKNWVKLSVLFQGQTLILQSQLPIDGRAGKEDKWEQRWRSLILTKFLKAFFQRSDIT